jgi:hypothetical protein
MIDFMGTAKEAYASEQDKVIARVVLGGWKLVKVDHHGPDWVRYHVIGPDDRWYGSASTRYTAALKAEQIIEREDPTEGILQHMYKR